MRNYSWWLGRTARVRKKYTLVLGAYYSPKEVREWLKKSEWLKAKKERSRR